MPSAAAQDMKGSTRIFECLPNIPHPPWQRIFVPDDQIVSKGDWGDEMFLIYRGVVKLVRLARRLVPIASTHCCVPPPRPNAALRTHPLFFAPICQPCVFLPLSRPSTRQVEISEQAGKAVYLRDGDYFGEIAVLTCGKRMVSVRAVTYCHLYSLRQRLLERILQQHPECITNMLINMKMAYTNFNDIKAKILASLDNPNSSLYNKQDDLGIGNC